MLASYTEDRSTFDSPIGDIPASLDTPIDLTVNLAEFGGALDDTLARLCQGRFILHLQTKTLDKCRKLTERVKAAGKG